MSKLDTKSSIHKIDRKWVREEKRIFSEYPGMPRTGVFGDEENWLELIKFYASDVKWLLSLDHHKFWSYMIYSEKAHELLTSFLRESPPVYLKNNCVFREDIKKALSDVERLVFLVFLRLGTEKESESCYIRNFGQIIYNNYLFTVPVILDICLIYGTSNQELVKKMISSVVTAAPDFLDDFQEVIPHFVHVLNTVREKLLISSKLKERSNLISNEVSDLVIYLCDSVATIEIFFELYANVCQLFSRGEFISEIVHFYSSVLPQIFYHCSKKYESSSEHSLISNLIEIIRIDLLKIVKSIFDFVLNEANDILGKNGKKICEYLDLMIKLLAEPAFLIDYNLIYSIEYEIEYAVKNCQNVDLMKVNHILEGVALAISGNEGHVKENFMFEESDDTRIKLNSLVTEVKDIFPHLKENFIKQCLNYYNNNTERVIAAILENFVPLNLNQNEKNRKSEEMLELRERHRKKPENFNEVLDDKEDINKIKERYVQLSVVADEIYDDEYDDTYDENLDFSIKEGDETGRRPFVIPRVLRTGRENDECVEDEDNKGEEEKKGFGEDRFGGDYFTENSAVLREQMEQKRLEQSAWGMQGRGGEKIQNKQIFRSRDFKESHKSFIANHNRKKEASRKMARGMVHF